MRQEFFQALSLLTQAAGDPEAADLALATLEYCAAELQALCDEAWAREWRGLELPARWRGEVWVIE